MTITHIINGINFTAILSSRCENKHLRDWSLITGGGATMGGGGACEVLPLRRGGGKCFSHAEGATMGGGGHVKFYPYEGEAENVLAMLKGGGGGSTHSFVVV